MCVTVGVEEEEKGEWGGREREEEREHERKEEREIEGGNWRQERIRQRVREIRTLPQETGLKRSSPCMVKNSPKSLRIVLGVTVNELLSISHGAMRTTEWQTVFMLCS